MRQCLADGLQVADEVIVDGDSQDVQPGCDRLETTGGGVSVTLPEKAALDLDAATSGGGVRSDFAVDGATGRQQLKGRINGGGPLLFLRTNGGGIEVTRAESAVSRN